MLAAKMALNFRKKNPKPDRYRRKNFYPGRLVCSHHPARPGYIQAQAFPLAGYHYRVGPFQGRLITMPLLDLAQIFTYQTEARKVGKPSRVRDDQGSHSGEEHSLDSRSSGSQIILPTEVSAAISPGIRQKYLPRTFYLVTQPCRKQEALYSAKQGHKIASQPPFPPRDLDFILSRAVLRIYMDARLYYNTFTPFLAFIAWSRAGCRYSEVAAKARVFPGATLLAGSPP